MVADCKYGQIGSMRLLSGICAGVYSLGSAHGSVVRVFGTTSAAFWVLPRRHENRINFVDSLIYNKFIDLVKTNCVFKEEKRKRLAE